MRQSIIIGALLMLMSMSILNSFNILPVKASGTIYIRADGSVDPPDAPIQRNGNTYTFTDNIFDSIEVQRSNIAIDGAGYTLQGSGMDEWRDGFRLFGVSDVTINWTKITGWCRAIVSSGSSLYARIYNNKITNNKWGVSLLYSSNFNIVSHNEIALNYYDGLCLMFSSYNDIFANNVTTNGRGIHLQGASNSLILFNNITSSKEGGVCVESPSLNNYVTDNIFIANTPAQACILTPGNSIVWKFNYWSDYAGVDLYSGPHQNEPGSDGIGDTPYIIDADNQDNYPRMNPWTWSDVPPVPPPPPLPYVYPPTCIVRLQKEGVEIDEIGVGQFFDIYVGDSIDDTGIREVRFSSDDSQDGIPTGEWTGWYDWDASSANWNAETKIRRWAFATSGAKEVWAEIKDNDGNSAWHLDSILAVYSQPDFFVAHLPQSYHDFSHCLTTISPGQSTTFKIFVPSIEGFNEEVLLSYTISSNRDWKPEDITLTLSPSSVTPEPDGVAESALTISTRPSLETAIYTITVWGLSGDKSRTTVITLAVAKYELFYEIDYMDGHRPRDSVLNYIQEYYIERGISLSFIVDDVVPNDPIVTNNEFWAVEATYNDLGVDSANGDYHNGVYYSKWKWVLYGEGCDREGVGGYCCVPQGRVRGWTGWKEGMTPAMSMAGGNYLFIGEQGIEGENVVLMHEMGHSIGILLLEWHPVLREWRELYDSDFTSVMANGMAYRWNTNIEPHYSDEYWNEKNIEIYRVSKTSDAIMQQVKICLC